MARGANQKSKLLTLYLLLLERTDEDHQLSTQQIIEYLEENGIGAERKSVYADMETLRSMGVDIQSRKGRGAGWFIGERDFQLAEVKLLMDAVQSSRFITQRKSDALIRKLERLASNHQAQQLPQKETHKDRQNALDLPQADVGQMILRQSVLMGIMIRMHGPNRHWDSPFRFFYHSIVCDKKKHLPYFFTLYRTGLNSRYWTRRNQGSSPSSRRRRQSTGLLLPHPEYLAPFCN